MTVKYFSIFILIICIITTGCASLPIFDAQSAMSDSDNPASDILGWENGFWHNESIRINQRDGLNDTEMEALVSRAMARVEYLRNREFKKYVPVSVISREEYRENGGNNSPDPSYVKWNNQIWEALFIVGEETNVVEVMQSTTTASVLGFYSPSDNEIKIITENPSEPTIKRGTLVHELVHALQDQYVGLYSKQFFAQTQDESLAIDGVIEGEANYIQYLYAQRCGEEWSCVDPPQQSDDDDNDSTTQFNTGIFVTIFHPYSDGPVYIHWLVQQNGWSAVNNAYKNPPETTEQIIHTTNESQVPISFQNRSQNGWRVFPKQGKNGWDSVGEASIFAMFWYQSRQTNTSLIEGRNFTTVQYPYDTYNYVSEPSMGWANDMIVPYHKRGQYGYVWITKWDTRKDAVEFKTTYIAMLKAHQADQMADQLWVIPNGSFADTFKIIHTNQTVIIVNGPDQEAVANIYPESPSNVETDQPTTASPTESFGQSGFGIIIAMIAFLIVIIHSIRKNS